jgi:hypothetical protein
MARKKRRITEIKINNQPKPSYYFQENNETTLKCPQCQTEFIPRTFQPIRYQSGVRVEGYLHDQIQAFWITYCIECGYILHFAMEIIHKERIYQSGRETPQTTNNIKIYAPPCQIYKVYLEELWVKINSILDHQLTKSPLKQFLEIYDIDTTQPEHLANPFKFLVRFISSIEKFHDMIHGKENIKEMPVKIKELSLSAKTKSHLINLNKIRNKVVHDGMDLDTEDISMIFNSYLLFINDLLINEFRSVLDQIINENIIKQITNLDICSEFHFYFAKVFDSYFRSSKINQKIKENLSNPLYC